MNRNSDTIKEIILAQSLQVAQDLIPNPIPIVESNPKIVKNILVKSGQAINATSSTLLTTPTDRDLFLVGYDLDMIKDATSTSTTTSIIVTPEDATAINLIRISTLTLTAQTANKSNFFGSHAIKLKRGTTITISNASATANITASATIYYFIGDTNSN